MCMFVCIYTYKYVYITTETKFKIMQQLKFMQ